MRPTHAGWRAYTTTFFLVVIVIVVYNGVMDNFLPSLDRAGWRTHNAVSFVYLGDMVSGEYRLCSQEAGTPSTIGSAIDLYCTGDQAARGRMLSVTYHGRIDRASATVTPHWKCQRRDWTLECWAVD